MFLAPGSPVPIIAVHTALDLHRHPLNTISVENFSSLVGFFIGMRLLVYPIIQACAVSAQGQLRPACELPGEPTWLSQWRRIAFSWLQSRSQAEIP